MPRTLMQSVVGTLQNKQRRLENELRCITAVLTAFGNVYFNGNRSKPAVSRQKRTISAAGRKRIAAAQRARWAKVRAGKKK